MTALPVAVIGGGIMGRGIAASLALAGHPVAIVEPNADEVLDRVAQSIRGAARAPDADADADADAVAHADAAIARVRLADLPDAVGKAALVIEAVPEDLAVKEPVWRELGRHAAAGAILATNTSAFDIDAIAAWVDDPSVVLGTHWFNPAEVIPCVEVVVGTATDAEVVQRVVQLLEAAGKEPSVVRNSPGFVANRIQFALVREALLCLEEGLASADDIDRIVRGSFGVRLAALGPLANADLGGLDTYRSILRFLSSELGDRFTPPRLLDELVDAGRFGVKTGAGIGDYPGDEGAQLANARDQRLRRLLAARDDQQRRDPAAQDRQGAGR
jgi:3-hydroxybutyryl-CoA dehydrogenase